MFKKQRKCICCHQTFDTVNELTEDYKISPCCGTDYIIVGEHITSHGQLIRIKRMCTVMFMRTRLYSILHDIVSLLDKLLQRLESKFKTNK